MNFGPPCMALVPKRLEFYSPTEGGSTFRRGRRRLTGKEYALFARRDKWIMSVCAMTWALEENDLEPRPRQFL